MVRRGWRCRAKQERYGNGGTERKRANAWHIHVSLLFRCRWRGDLQRRIGRPFVRIEQTRDFRVGVFEALEVNARESVEIRFAPDLKSLFGIGHAVEFQRCGPW